MTRREMIALVGSVPAWLTMGCGTAEQPQTRTSMGGTTSAFGVRARLASENKEAFDYLDHAHSIGLGGIQMRLDSVEADYIKGVRQKLEDYEMYLEGTVRLPEDKSGLAEFEAMAGAYKEAGATVLRTPMTGRRYEVYENYDAYKKHFEQCQRSVELVEPLLQKMRMRLAIENHKGWRVAEQVAWLERVSSTAVGACLDCGNNISLCDDPMEVFKALAPYTFACHIKDMGVEETDDGFLLSEVPFGEGMYDIPWLVRYLRQWNPQLNFGLEMITRDPLHVPCLTDKYLATFDAKESPLPAKDIARTLAMVRANKPEQPLQRISELSPEEQVRAEDENNRKCIVYAREVLDL